MKEFDAGNATTGYLYRKEASGSYIVGLFVNGTFLVASRHDSAKAARRRVNYLNGGSVPTDSSF